MKGMTRKWLSSFLPVGGVALATLLVTQCKVDKLIGPPSGGVLTLNPLSLADSAPLGSTAARTQRLMVSNGATGRITWTATTAHGSAWLHLGAATGTAPDTLPLTLLPTGLALGTYRDTIVVTGSGSSAGELRVPVQFSVQACTIAPIAVGTQTAGTLGGASCGAPHRSNHPAALYSFTGSSGDSVSLQLTAPAGYLVLDSSTTLSKPSFAEAGTCGGVAGNPCLYYQRLPRTGSYIIEVTTNAATDSGAYTLTLSPPRNPSAPGSLTQLQSDSATVVATGDTVAQNAVVLRGVVSDPDRPDSLRLEVEVKPTSVAFTGTSTVLGAPVANGQAALVRVAGLADDSAYHWRARAVDQTGRSGNWLSYGGNAETVPDFVLGNSLVLPTTLGQFKSDGVTALAVGASNVTQTLVFKGFVADPAQGEFVRLEVEYQPVGTPFSNVANVSSPLTMPPATVQVTSTSLTDNVSYHWQAREVSQTGRASSWTSFGGNAESAVDFKEALTPQTLVFLASPTTDTAGAPVHPTVQVAAQDLLGHTLASFTGNVTVAIDSNPGGATLSGTATVAAVAGVATFPGLSLDKTGVGYRLRASVVSPALTVKSGLFNVVSGAISTTLSTVIASPATIHASKGDSVSTITVTVKDPLGNPVPGAVVTLADTATGDSLTQPANPTNASGVATGTVSARVAGAKHITAAAGGQALTQVATVTVIPAHAQILAFTVEPANAAAGAVLAPAVQVTARDSLGNTDTSYAGNVTVAIGTNPGGATLGGTKTVPAAHGIASFGDLTLDKTGTGYTLTTSAIGVPGTAASSSFNITAGAGTRLAFTIEPSTTVAGASIAPAIEVTAQDGSGNTVTTFTGTVTLAIASNPGGDTLSGTKAVAAVGGRATFSSLTLHKMGAGYTLSASATSFTGATSTAFNVRPGAATQLAYTTEPTGTSAGATLPASAVTAQDAFGNTDTTYAGTVTAAIDSNPGGGTLGGTVGVGAVQGVATFSTLTIDKAGIGYRLAATATSLTRARSNPFNITAGGVSATLSTVIALPSSITAGGTGSTVSVTARDSHGNPIAGATVVLGSTGTANTLTQPASTTDGTGLATGSITSTKAESKTVSATVDGVLLNQTATVTVGPGPISAGQSTLGASPTTIAAGGSSVITATARDAFGNPIPGLTAVLAATGTGNTVTQPPSPTDGSGVATGALSSTVAGAKIVSATIGAVAVTQTDTVTVTSGGATHLVFSVAPGNTTAGSGITPAIQVSALDANNNVAAGFTGSVTLAIGTNPGGGTLSGTASVAAVAGVATFSGMRIDRAANGYTLDATSSGLVSTVSGTFNILAGPAVKLGVMSQPSAAAVNGVAFAQQPVIQIQDSMGNPVSQSGTTITAAIASGAGTLGGTLTASTGAGGFATFTNLQITGLVGARTLTFTAGGLTSVTSGTVAISAGGATQIAVSAGNHQAATAGSAVGTPPSVIVTDVSGNPVSGVGVTFALPGTAGANGSLTGAGQSTNGSGIATVGSWTLGTTAKPDSMTATSTGLTGSPLTFVDTAKVGAAANIAKFSGDNLVGPVGSRLATPHDALVTDANGNPVPGVAVSWAAVGGGSVDSATSHTDANGHAMMNRTLGSTPGSESTTATVGALTPVSFAVTAQVGGATQMAVNGGDRQTDTVGVTLPTALSVIVKDALSNPVSGVTISWSVLNGGGSVSAPTSVTNASGIASINWTLGTAMSPVDSTQLVQATGVASPVTFTAFTVPGAVSASQTSVTASSPISASAGSSPSTITITARDQFGNVIKGKTVTLVATGSGNTLTNPAAATDVNGVATGTLSSTKAESKVITATVGGVGITQQPTVVVNPAAAASLSFVQQPTSVVAGASITPAITVQILDAFNNPVTAASNAVSLALAANPGSSTLSGSVNNVAAVGGVATFANASLNKSGTGYTLAASATGLTGQTSSTFNVTSGTVSAALSTVAATSPITAGGAASTVTVTARDGNGNPVAGATVVVASSGSGNTVTQPAGLTGAGGIATGSVASTVAESKTISATINGVAITQTAAVVVNPGAAHTIASNGGNGQTATVATAVTIPPSVIVTDVNGNPVPGVAVTFAVTGGAGTVNPTTPVTTNASGIAQVTSWTLGNTAGANTLGATATGLTGSPVTFTATGAPGAADHFAFTQEPTSAVAGAGIAPTVTVAALDAQGNVATSFTGSITLAIANNAGGGALSGTTTVPAAAGVASFPGVSIDKAGTGYTLSASNTGPTPATSTAFNITPGAATHLTFSQQPTSAASGVAVSPAVTVTALDASDNVATGFANQVSLAIANNAGGGTLSGGAAVSPIAGVATFSAVSLDKVGTGYTLSASATGVTGATSTGFNITPGTATKLAFTVEPSNAAAGASIAPAVQVTAQDAAGNIATGFSGSVTVAIGNNSGGAALSGTTVITASAGMANFSNLSLDKVGAGYTLTASATSLTGAVSTGFDITPAAAAALVFTVQPASDTAAGSLGTIQVTARDGFGNTATSFVNQVTLAIANNAGGGALSGTTGVTPTAGVASFPGLSINKAGTGYTLSATATGVTGTTSAAFNITPGNATHLVFTTQPTDLVAGAAIAPAVTVTALDANNNVSAAAGSDTIRIGTNAGGATLSGDTIAARVSGVSTHSALSLDKAGTGYTLTARSGALVGTTSNTFNVTAGAVSDAQTTVGATSPITAGGTGSTVTVLARDASGNPVANATVLLAVSGTDNTITQPGLTASNGVATGSFTSTVAESKTVSATVNGIAITQTAPVVVNPGGVSASQSTVGATSPITAGGPASTVTVTAKDGLGNPIAGAAVVLASSGTGNTVTQPVGTTNASGVATGTLSSTVAESKTVSATINAVGITQTATVVVNPGTPANLNFVVQPSTATATAAIAPPIQVEIRDAFNNRVTTATNQVTLAIGTDPGSGTLSGTVTNVSPTSGIATFSNASIDKAGTGYTLTAAATGLTSATSSAFNITAGSVSAAQSTVSATSPITASSGASQSTITVTAKDGSGNPVSGATVVLAATGTGNTLTQPVGTTNASGVATGTVSSTVAESKTVSATISSVAITQTATVVVNPAAATQLVFTGQPASDTAAGLLGAVQVTARDQFGNSVTAFAGTDTIAIANNAGGGTLAGTLTVAATAGVSNFPGLSINKTGTGYTLSAKSGALTLATSSAFNVTPGNPTHLAFTTPPSSVTAGATIAPPVVVAAQDANNNTVTGFAGSDTIRIGTNNGGGVLSGDSVAAFAAGVATHSTLSINKAGTGYTLTGQSGTLTGATSAAFNVTSGSVSASLTTVAATSPIAAGGTGSTITVTAKDGLGNPVAGATVVIAVSGSGNTFSQPAVTNASGVATTTLTSTVAESKTVSATVNSVAINQTVTVVVNPGPVSAAQSTVAATSPITASAGASQSTITVTAKDANGNLISGAAVVLAATGSGNTLTQPAGTTSGVGVATGTLSSTVAESKTVSATIGGVAITQTATVLVNPGTANNLNFVVQPSSAVSGASIAPAIQVEVRDALNNRVTTATNQVTLAIGTNPGTGTLSGTVTNVSPASGIATFSNASIDKAGTGYTLTAAATGLTGVTSTTFNITAGTVSAAQSTVSATSPITAGGAGSTITVTAKDASGNPIAGATVVLAATGTGNTLTQPVGTTNASGVATGTLASTVAESKTVSATINAVAITQTATVVVNAGAVSAAQSTVSATSPITAGGTGSTITATAKDASGNPVAGATVVLAATGTGNTLTQPVGTTNALGVATGTLASTVAESKTVSATMGGVAITQTATVVVNAGAAAKVAVNAGDAQSATTGAAVPVAPSVLVTDINNNPVSGVTVTFAVATGGGSLTGTNPTTTSASGVAAIGSWTLGNTAGANSLTATASGFAGGGNPVTFTATGTAGTATTIAAASTPPASATVGTAVTAPSVLVTDTHGNPVSGVSVTFAVTVGNGSISPTTPITTDGAGHATLTTWTLGTTAGTNTVTASSTGLTGSPVSFSVTGTAGAAAKIAASAGQGQSATAGSAVTTAPSVLVTDINNNPVSGVTVTFAVATGGGSLTGTNPTTTNASGLAAIGSWTLGATAGPNSLTATATGFAGGGNPVTFTATGTVGTATTIAAASTPPASATVGTTVTAPSVLVTDSHGNPVSGVSVTFAVTVGNGSISPTTPITTDGAGHATLTTWTLGTAAGTNTVTATATGLTGSPVSFSVTGTAGAAAKIAVNAGQGQTATAGSAVATAPSVLVTDIDNNPVAGVAVTFAVATGGGSLTGTNPATTNASGVAGIGSWTLGTTAGANSLTATATGFAGGGNPVTFTATGTVGAAAKIAVNAGDAQSATAGTAVATAPSVLVTDLNNNPVAGVSVTFAVASGGGSVTGTNPVTTSGAGIATIGSWILGSTVGANTMTATATGFTGGGNPVTFTGTGTTGAAATIAAASTPPASATVGSSVTAPSVLVTDTHGNPVSGVSVTFAVTVGNGSISPITPITTDGAGHATLTTWTLGTTAGTNTVTATATGLTGSPVSFSVTGTAGAATKILVNAGQAQTATAGSAVPTAPSVLVTDNSNNPVAGVTVTFAVASGGGALTGTNPTTTNASGVAAIGSWTLGTTAGANSLTATASGFAGGGNPVTFTATGSAGAAAKISVNAGNAQTATAGTAVSTAPAVLVTDLNNNPVSGTSVTFAVATGGGTLTGTNPVSTGSNGIAAIGSWILGNTAGANSITATATGFAGGGNPVTFTATGTAGAATTIAAASTPPASATVGTSVTAPSVLVTDTHGNPVSGVSVTFAVTVGNGSISPTTPIVTDGAGHATLTTWTLGTTAGANTVTATSTGLTGSPITFSVAGTAGPVSASQSTVTASSPITASAGSSQSTITVTAMDANGNVISGATVVLGATGSNNTVTGSGGSTNSSGVLTATLSSTTAESKTVSATINGVPITQTATVVVNAGAATQLVFTGQPTTTANNATINPAVVVTAEDAFGNTDQTFTGTVNMAIAHDPNLVSTLNGTTAVAAVAGVATFGDLSISTLVTGGTGFTLGASSGLLTATSNSFNITP
jgi:hypothetical protein